MYKIYRNNLYFLIIFSTLLLASCKKNENQQVVTSNIKSAAFALEPVKLSFNNQNTDKYISPIIYLVNGNIPRIAVKDNVITTGGISGDDSKTSAFEQIYFTSSIPIDLSKIEILPLQNNSLCNAIKLKIQNNSSFFFAENNTFRELKYLTSCSFKFISNDYDFGDNKITLLFNYTIKDWNSSLGNGTGGQLFTNLLLSQYSINELEDLTSLSFINEKLGDSQIDFDISPVSSLINLNFLFLRYFNLKRIQPYTFFHLTNLNDLELINNLIDKIERNTFIGLDNLQVLSLDSNNIDNIEDNSFLNLNKLFALQIDYNYLKKINNNTFNGLYELEIMHLSNNNIINIDQNAFDVFPKLYVLSIESNKMVQIPIGLFKKLANLQYLYFENNLLSNLEYNTFDGLENIKTLTLGRNKLKYLPSHFQNKFLHLRALVLSANEIKLLPQSMMYMFPNLYIFYIDFNNIKFIDINNYNWMKRMVTCEASGNIGYPKFGN